MNLRETDPVIKLNSRAEGSFFLVVLVALCFCLCYHFLQPGLKSWDEAVYANNAIEMSKNGHYWVMYNDGQPDFFNTKPPLVIWLQSLFISIFGVNEFAVRLPSFISLFLVVIFLFRFLKRRTNSIALPYMAEGILLSSYGFTGFHGFATGDLDATLCLWTTLYSLIIFDKIILDDGMPPPKWMYISGLFFFLAFLTKSAAALLPLPGLLVSLFLFKRQSIVFRNKNFYATLFILISLIAGYYLMMEYKQPGYFSHAWQSEYKRIYSNIMPWHSHSFFYYFKNLGFRFFPWVWLLIPSIFLALRSKSGTIKRLTLFCSVFVACYFLIISIPSVKLEWYDIPAYPFLAIIASVAFLELLNRVKLFFKNKKKEICLSGLMLFSLLTAFVLKATLNKIKNPPFKEPLEREGNALRSLINDKTIRNLKILMYAEHPEHYNQVNFYKEKYFENKQVKPVILRDVKLIRAGDTVLLCQIEKLQGIKKIQADTIQKTGDCLLLYIKSIYQ
ncbi:MAG TPA: glycosyltransferase family 39 protein [Chitinophagaceae bacterium]|nr:glycosyltransferase family 39 protein [Chitinophagaceae bacterium]